MLKIFKKKEEAKKAEKNAQMLNQIESDLQNLNQQMLNQNQAMLEAYQKMMA